MRIIPAIDVMDGRCTRLTKGDFGSPSTYKHDPLTLARSFQDHGLKYLHLVDLDGAREKRIMNWKTLETIASATSLIIDFGGGIMSADDIRIALENGASMINIGSSAAIFPELFREWLKKFGTEKIILAADAAERKIKVSGWVQKTDIDVIGYIAEWVKQGVRMVACTDISKDGTLDGPSEELYREILSVTNVKLIASGGISSVSDLEVLKQAGCDGAIIGKAIYEGKIKLEELAELC